MSDTVNIIKMHLAIGLIGGLNLISFKFISLNCLYKAKRIIPPDVYLHDATNPKQTHSKMKVTTFSTLSSKNIEKTARHVKK